MHEFMPLKIIIIYALKLLKYGLKNNLIFIRIQKLQIFKAFLI